MTDKLDTKAIRAQMEAEAGMRALLRAGCDLRGNEYDNHKASITMPDGSLSANPLDAWAVENVAAMEDWIASVKATLYPATEASNSDKATMVAMLKEYLARLEGRYQDGGRA